MHKADRIAFSSIVPWQGKLVCAEGRYANGGGNGVGKQDTGTEQAADNEQRGGADQQAGARRQAGAQQRTRAKQQASAEQRAGIFISLKTTLKAEINADAWSTLHSDTSRPFEKPTSGRIAVKVINHLGDEVMKVFRV